MVNSIKFGRLTSPAFRRVLFSTFVLLFSTRLHALYPLLTDLQRTNLDHFYYISFKRVHHCMYWQDLFFAFAHSEQSLDDVCYVYWTKYLMKLIKSLDGYSLLEQSCLNGNCFRGFISHADMFGRILDWYRF